MALKFNQTLSLFAFIIGFTGQSINGTSICKEGTRIDSPHGNYHACIRKDNPDAIAIYSSIEPQGFSYTLPFGSSKPSLLEFSPDGNYLTSLNQGSHDITIYQMIGDEPARGTSYPLPRDQKFHYMGFSSDGRYLFIASNQQLDSVQVFKVSDKVWAQDQEMNDYFAQGKYASDVKRISALLITGIAATAILYYGYKNVWKVRRD